MNKEQFVITCLISMIICSANFYAGYRSASANNNYLKKRVYKECFENIMEYSLCSNGGNSSSLEDKCSTQFNKRVEETFTK